MCAMGAVRRVAAGVIGSWVCALPPHRAQPVPAGGKVGFWVGCWPWAQFTGSPKEMGLEHGSRATPFMVTPHETKHNREVKAFQYWEFPAERAGTTQNRIFAMLRIG